MQDINKWAERFIFEKHHIELTNNLKPTRVGEEILFHFISEQSQLYSVFAHLLSFSS